MRVQISLPQEHISLNGRPAELLALVHHLRTLYPRRLRQHATSWLAADLHDLIIILVHEGLPGLVVQIEWDLIHIKPTIRLELAVL